MITKHVDFFDRFNRAIPVLGAFVLIYQAKRHLAMAAEDDAAFEQLMGTLESEPEDRLVGHGVKQERFLLAWIAAALLTSWVVCGALLFGRLDWGFAIPITNVTAMAADYLAGIIAFRVFTSLEEKDLDSVS